TFAALNVVRRDLNNMKKNSNIFNIVNYTDPVPFVPGFKMGKYGYSGVFNIVKDSFNMSTIAALRKLSLKWNRTSMFYLARGVTFAVIPALTNHSMPNYEDGVEKNTYDTFNWDFDGLSDDIDEVFAN